ncbi:MAG: LL-diaminopimelate aminotransferase [Acholeplasmatales bacterium]|nr:LL-diaminopimelate aminotransferase [Acholeplasmatales bacterium]
MKIKLNENFKNVSESYLFSTINKKVAEYKEQNPNAPIIKMGIGDVTLPLPKIVIDAMLKATREMGEIDTFRGYPPEWGYTFTKEAVQKYYKNYNVSLTLDDIFISDGAKTDVSNILDILGHNEVYITSPVYPVYIDSNTMNGNSIHIIEGNKGNRFLPLPVGLDNSAKVIYLCSPNNPTGASYTYDELKMWVDYAKSTGSLIIFDSAYEAFIEDKNIPHSIFELEGARECALEIGSLSKSCGFTGVRCGYTIIPANLEINKIWKRREATKFNGVSYVTQRAAEQALSPEGVKACQENIAYYKRNAKALAECFDELGIFYTGGHNSPYIWLECPNGMKSWDFFDFLLTKANVIGTPGVGFGGEGYFRLTSFNTYENTLEAIERIKKVLKK